MPFTTESREVGEIVGAGDKLASAERPWDRPVESTDFAALKARAVALGT